MNLFDRIKAKLQPKVKKPCPQAKGTIVIFLTSADNTLAIEGAKAEIKGPTPGSSNTDDMGVAIFTDRTPGDYTASVTLPTTLKGYRMTHVTPNGSVSADGTEFLFFKAAPIGNLQLKVYDDFGKPVPHPTALWATGPQHVTRPEGNSVHTFNDIIAGTYEVFASVPSNKYETIRVSKERIVVPPGGTGNAILTVKRLPINVITPKIEMEYKVVVLDRKLSAHQDKAEEKIVVDDVTFIQVSVTQNPGIPFYTGKGTFEVSPANVDVFTDAECKKPFTGQKITNQKLMSGDFKLYFKAKTKGKFTAKLTLDPPDNPEHMQVKGPAQEEMSVVELEMKVHRFEKSDLDKIEVDPDVNPYSTYLTALESKALPEQKVLTDAQKIKEGRILHAQSAGKDYGRAKLVLKKLDAAQWPADTDSYEFTLKQSNGSGKVRLFNAEKDGAEVTSKITVADLKTKDLELWVEGKETTRQLRDVVLDLGINRSNMAAPHTQSHLHKRRGDWARFTVVQVKEVKVDYTPVKGAPVAWDSTANRFHINYKADPQGRKVTISAKLTEPLKDIPLHFLLAPDSNNMKAANWGIDLPATWLWGSVKKDVKHLDKADRKKLMHLSQKTDAHGAVKQELTLSRFGGDKFHPGVYIDQDAHLAKFVHGHTTLGVRKPFLASHPIEVWRKFWAEIVLAEGVAFPGTVAAEGQYTLVKATMERAPDIPVTRAKIDKMNPKAIYPKYMVYINGGDDDALVVSDNNKAQFFAGVKTAADKPVKIPILVCDAQWDPDGNSAAAADSALATSFPIHLNVGKLVIDPPLQGGKLLKSGKWTAAEPDGAGGWQNVRTGNLNDGDVYVAKTRTALRHVTVKAPAGVIPVAGTQIWIEDLVVGGAKGPYLGEYSSATKRILAVYNQKSPDDIADFPNTIVHEIGHAFNQIMHAQTEGIPAHPNQADRGQGNHCQTNTNKCVMYDSGPIPGSLNRYCDVCHPYLLLVDMQKLK